MPDPARPTLPALTERPQSDHLKIAVVRASRIGDFVCAVPALYDLKAAFPSSELVLIALPIVEELVSCVPAIDRFLPFPGFPGMAEQFFSASALSDFLRKAQAEQFDLALQMHGSGTYSNTFTVLLGARLAAGFCSPGGHASLLDAALEIDESLAEVTRCRHLVQLLGAKPVQRSDWLVVDDVDNGTADSMLSYRPQPCIGIHPGARDSYKRWPFENCLELARLLTKRLGATVILLGDSAEPLRETRAATTAPRRACGVVDLRGHTSLRTLVAVVRRLDLLITTDSAPAHMAYAVDTPSITLFGGTDPARWGPSPWPGAAPGRHTVVAAPASCRPCDPGPCVRKRPCLARLSAATVFDHSLSLFAGLPSVASSGDLGPQKKSPPFLAGSI